MRESKILKLSKEKIGIRWYKNNIRESYFYMTLLLLCSIILSSAMMGISIAMKLFIDIASGSRVYNIRIVVIFTIGIILIIGLCQIAESVLQIKIKCMIEEKMRKSLLEKLFAIPILIYNRKHTSTLFTKLTTDVQVLAEFIPYKLIGSIFQEILMYLLSLILMFMLSWEMAVLLLVLVPILMLLMIWLTPYVQKKNSKLSKTEDENRKLVQEVLEKNELFRVYNMPQIVLKNVVKVYQQKKKVSIQFGILTGILDFINTFMGVGLFVMAMGVGALLTSRGRITVGTLVAIINLVSYLYGPFTHLSMWLTSISTIRTSLLRIEDILNEKEEVIFKREESICINEIEVSSVNFEYELNIPILYNINAYLKKGRLIAIRGESGSGKSTFLRTLMGIYPVSSGDIEVINKLHREKVSINDIAYMSNDNSVFSGTLKENIIMNEVYDEERWFKAIKDANLDEVIETLDKGSQSIIDESNLSSGQLQRICLARAFYRDAPILIMDEPTSFLDVESINRVMQALIRMSKEKICIIVTHNREVLKKCDEIYFLNKHQLMLEKTKKEFC